MILHKSNEISGFLHMFAHMWIRPKPATEWPGTGFAHITDKSSKKFVGMELIHKRTASAALFTSYFSIDKKRKKKCVTVKNRSKAAWLLDSWLHRSLKTTVHYMCSGCEVCERRGIHAAY